MDLPKLYGIVNNKTHAQWLLAGGIRIIQYRNKTQNDANFAAEAKAIQALCKEHNAIFVVNDRVEIGLDLGVHGVHFGQSDMGQFMAPVAQKLHSSGMIIGISAHTEQQAKTAEKWGASYIGAGAVWPTPTKPDAKVIGKTGLKSIIKSVKIPVFAIGGICVKNAKTCLDVGAHGVCCVSAVCKESAESTSSAITELYAIIKA